MRTNKTDFDYFIFIMYMCYQSESIMYNLKPGTVILDHLCLGEIPEDVLLSIPLGLFNYQFPNG